MGEAFIVCGGWAAMGMKLWMMIAAYAELNQYFFNARSDPA